MTDYRAKAEALFDEHFDTLNAKSTVDAIARALCAIAAETIEECARVADAELSARINEDHSSGCCLTAANIAAHVRALLPSHESDGGTGGAR